MVDDRDYFPFRGGLNLVDTALSIAPGQLLACRNYEPDIRGGYERTAGYERLDGRTAPSSARYWLLGFDAGVPARYPTAGTTVTGLTSGATAVALTAPIHANGAGNLILGRLVGTFQDNEALQVSGQTMGNADGVARVSDADSEALDREYRRLAVADLRALIQPLPGSGPVRGVVTYNGVVYAVRDNVGATAGVLHKATAGGWVAVSLGSKLAFAAGNVQPAIGATVTGGTSGATGVVRRIVLSSGDWSTDDAAGYLILTGVTGTFQAEALTGSGTLNATGAQVANTLPPGGKYEFRVHNFYGHTSTQRLYAVNGVGPALEYQDSPSFLCPIATGMTIDTPTHLAVHKGCMWLSFPGGSIQKSGAADPASWTVVRGAAEIGIGAECTGFLEEVGQTLFVFARHQTRYIAGNEADGYQMDNYTNETGAYEGTIQRLGRGIYLDDRGFTTLAAAQEYGNFSANSISEAIAPLVRELRNSATASVVSTAKSRARFFFGDGAFLTIAFAGRKLSGFTASQYPVDVLCAWSGEDTTGDELIVFGSDDGYVYQADRGTSFDGEAIQSFMRLVFHHSRTPSRVKRYRRASVDVSARGPTTLRATVDYSFADPQASGEPVKDVVLKGGGGFWDVSRWNEFRWSAGVVATADLKLEGSGTNISLLFSSEADDEESHTLTGVNFHISQRRLNRST